MTDARKVVLREPSAAMFIAGTKALAEAEGSFARMVWYAMYDAAPAAPAKEPQLVCHRCGNAPHLDDCPQHPPAKEPIIEPSKLIAAINVQLSSAQVALLSGKPERYHAPLVWLNVYGREAVKRIADLEEQLSDALRDADVLAEMAQHPPQDAPDDAALERWGFNNGFGVSAVARLDDGYWTPWHIAHALLLSQQASNGELHRELAETYALLHKAEAERDKLRRQIDRMAQAESIVTVRAIASAALKGEA